MKKGTLILIIAILFVFTIGIISIVKNNTLTPYDFLVKETKNEIASIKPKEMLYQVDIDEREHLIFYINEKGSLACAIIEKKLLSYSLKRISSEVLLTNSNKPANFMFSSYKKGRGRAWIDWGIIRDSSIAKVLINGKEATIIEAKGLRIFYSTGEGKTTPTELVYQLLDAQGQPLFE